MTDRRTTDDREDGPEEMFFPGYDHSALDANELRRRRIAAWIAAGGTFTVIIALWAMLLPVSLGDAGVFGFKHSPAWQALRTRAAEQAPEFQRSVQEMQQTLNDLEKVQQEEARRAAAEREAAELRARIEASGSASANADADGTDETNSTLP